MNPRAKNQNDFSHRPAGAGGGGCGIKRGGGASRHRALSATPRWQIERARALHRICVAIERRHAAGATLAELIAEKSYAWRNHRLRCDGRRIRLSRTSIYRAFHHWKNSGQSSAAFTLRYCAPRKITLTSIQCRAFIHHAAAPGELSAGAAIRLLARWLQCSPCTIRRKLSPHVRHQLRRLYRARLASTRAERFFKNAVK